MNDEMLLKMYFDWLTELIECDDRTNLYETLLHYLFDTNFVWLESIPLDENRAEDGLELRKFYAKLLGENGGPRLLELLQNKPCSMLEMLVAFADKLTQLVSLEKYEFFWMFIENLGLAWATEYDFDINIVGEIVNDFMYGTVHGHEPKGKENPPVLFPCREVYNNMNDNLFLQANMYLKSYFL